MHEFCQAEIVNTDRDNVPLLFPLTLTPPPSSPHHVLHLTELSYGLVEKLRTKLL